MSRTVRIGGESASDAIRGLLRKLLEEGRLKGALCLAETDDSGTVDYTLITTK